MIILLLLIPAIIIVYYYYRKTVPDVPKKRKTLLMVLRSLTIIILLVLLFNPILDFRRNLRVYPEIVFLTDYSMSMDLPAGDQSKSELLDGYYYQLTNISENHNYQTRQFIFADGIEGMKTTSNLSNTLHDLAQRSNLNNVEKVVLLSDGWFSDEQLDIINRFEIPISTVQPQVEVEDFDLGINRLLYNERAYKEEEISIIADVFADNYDDKSKVKLFVKNELIDTKEVNFEQGSTGQATFDHTFEETGLHPIRVEIEPLNYEEEESTLSNNVYPGAIRVLDKRVGINIITDKLRWDVRFINKGLIRDDRKDVSLFVVRNNRIYQGRERVELHDVFEDHLQMLAIINHGDLRLNSEQIEMIDNFVANGGGLLFTGKPLPALEELLAATSLGINRLFRTTLKLTAESQKYQTFSDIDASKIPPVEHYYVETMVHPHVLARFNNDETSPAIIYNEYKQGRVMYMPFFNLWRWQLRVDGGHYNFFLHNLAAWLANPEGVDFFAQTERSSYFLGEKVTINLTAFDETMSVNPNLNPKLQLFDEEQNIIKEEFLRFEEQQYTISIPNLASGEYRFKITEETIDETAGGDFVVSSITAEGRNHGFNYPLLSYISRQTGGQVVRDDNLDEFQLKPASGQTQRMRFEIPLYRHWLIVSLFLAAFCLEIFLRKRWGLI